MKAIKHPRIYDAIFSTHLSQNRQMVFVSGPRQVGKTTTCQQLASHYFNWDVERHRETILAGTQAMADYLKLNEIHEALPVVVLDELHKMGRWKQFLKGFFDLYENRCRIVVTGSSRLNIYRHGGDSLMGRYFLYRMHPFSVGELLRQTVSQKCITIPSELDEESFQNLWKHGGFPEPFIKCNSSFTRRWRGLRSEQLFKEDVRELTRIQALGQVESLGLLLAKRSGERVVYANLASEIRVAENTIRSWISTLCNLHHGFLVRPWFRNVTKALRKEPKWFLRDWSGIKDVGQRAETFIACHLLKAVEGWTDMGLGSFELRFLRDKQKREVDFLIVKDDEPWILIEVKNADDRLSPSLAYFQQQTKAAHAFQVVMDKSYVDVDCFTRHAPTVVPARTLLSQLI